MVERDDVGLPGRRLAGFALVFALVVVVLGAYTRLVDAGLGCPDWPGCYGFLTVPEHAEDVAIAEARYPHAPVESAKGWPEMVHRYAAGTLGLLILSLTIIALRHRSAGYPWRHALLLLALVILQAAFGMWTVTLKLWPQVVTAHLLGGMATLALLYLYWLRLSPPRPGRLRTVTGLRRLALGGLVLVVLQVALGGWLTSNYAALACPDLPTCHGEWWPDMDWGRAFDPAHQELGPNYLGGVLDHPERVAIHMAHRIGALLLTAYLLFLVFALHGPGHNRSYVFAARSLLGLLVLQIALGISNVIWQLPLAVAVAHNAVAALLLLAVVRVNYLIWTAEAS